jgi:hypothetical protein
LVAVSRQRYARQAKVERKQTAMAKGSRLQAERKRLKSSANLLCLDLSTQPPQARFPGAIRFRQESSG